MDHARSLANRACERGEAAVACVIVKDQTIVAERIERVRAEHDPTGHAEIDAVREACRRLKTLHLSDCVLYTTVEPCLMCSYAIRAASVGDVVIDAPYAEGGVTGAYPLLTNAVAAELPAAPRVLWTPDRDGREEAGAGTQTGSHAERDAASTLYMAVDFLLSEQYAEDTGDQRNTNPRNDDSPRRRGQELPWPSEIPEQGVGDGQALRHLVPALRKARNLGAAGYFAHMDPPTPAITWAGYLWAAATNQNLLHPDTAPIAREIERHVVSWLLPFFGMESGHFVGGSTLANITGLWAARQAGASIVAAADAAHLSVQKAADILSMEYVPLPTDTVGRIKEAALSDVLNRNRDVAVVLTAGNTATGAIDPLASSAVEPAAWVHVDAAWAGPLRLSAPQSSRLSGIERADSVSVSGHKWLFQPKDSALVLFRDKARANGLIGRGATYLKKPNVGIPGSRGAAAPLALAGTLLSFGREGIAERIKRCLDAADALAGLVRASPALQLRHDPQSGVVLWKPLSADPDQVAQRMRGADVSTVKLPDGTWLRSVAANPMVDPKSVVESALGALEEV